MKSTEVAEELRAFEGNIRPPDRAQAGLAGKCQHVPNNQVIGALRNIHTMKSPLKAHRVYGNNSTISFSEGGSV